MLLIQSVPIGVKPRLFIRGKLKHSYLASRTALLSRPDCNCFASSPFAGIKSICPFGGGAFGRFTTFSL